MCHFYKNMIHLSQRDKYFALQNCLARISFRNIFLSPGKGGNKIVQMLSLLTVEQPLSFGSTIMIVLLMVFPFISKIIVPFSLVPLAHLENTSKSRLSLVIVTWKQVCIMQQYHSYSSVFWLFSKIYKQIRMNEYRILK